MSRHKKTSALIKTAAEILSQHHPMTVRQVYYRRCGPGSPILWAQP
jgi:hypothetical protein